MLFCLCLLDDIWPWACFCNDELYLFNLYSLIFIFFLLRGGKWHLMLIAICVWQDLLLSPHSGMEFTKSIFPFLHLILFLNKILQKIMFYIDEYFSFLLFVCIFIYQYLWWLFISYSVEGYIIYRDSVLKNCRFVFFLTSTVSQILSRLESFIVSLYIITSCT